MPANDRGQLYGVAPGDFFTVTQIPEYASLLGCSKEGNGSKHPRGDCVEGAKAHLDITAPRRSGSRGCCSQGRNRRCSPPYACRDPHALNLDALTVRSWPGL